jgi:hypothetical protein
MTGALRRCLLGSAWLSLLLIRSTTTVAAAVTGPLSHGTAGYPPHLLPALRDVPPFSGTTACWLALEAACPFGTDAACQACAGAAATALAQAHCNASAIAHYCGAMPQWVSQSHVQHRTEHLSSPRRNLGAASVPRPDLEAPRELERRGRGRSDKGAAARSTGEVSAPPVDLTSAVFAGGCVNRGGGNTQFICNEADGAVDIFNASGHLTSTVKLGEPRGWICAAAAGVGAVVVLAGGGTVGDGPHSARADVLDLATGQVLSYPQALSVGRWGIGCANLGERAFFAGGKVTVSGYDNAWTTGVIDVFDASAYRAAAAAEDVWGQAPYNLSVPRESATVTAISGSLLVAGGWKKYQGKYMGDNTVDLFRSPVDASAASTTTSSSSILPPAPPASAAVVELPPQQGPPGGGGLTTFQLSVDGYSVGAAQLGDHAYVVGNQRLYVFSAVGLVASRPLPPAMAGLGGDAVKGGTIPAGHVQQNGVAVGGHLVCFVGATDQVKGDGKSEDGLYCYHVIAERWARFNCSVPHKGGGIARVGAGTVLVGGGFDPASPDSAPNDIVDVFTFQPPQNAAECQRAIEGLCSDARKASAGSCFVCCGHHAATLARSGCQEQDLNRFCTQN